LVEVPRVEAGVLFAIEPQEALDFGEGRPPRRGPAAPAVEEAEVAITRKAPAPAAHTARRAADDLRRLDPADLPAHRAQHHLTNRHSPLKGHRRIEHAGPPSRHSDPPGRAERTDHLLRQADRSCAPYRRRVSRLTWIDHPASLETPGPVVRTRCPGPRRPRGGSASPEHSNLRRGR